jgi:putative DNA methylase
MTDRRLIEERLPLAAVNAESAREKSIRHGHISTMHLWWARRPLAMSRAVVFGTLVPDPGDLTRRDEILDLLAQGAPFEASVNPARIRPLREIVAAAYPDGPPKVLDCFAGGGAIPLEALRLGCDVTAVDLNPVAHLIEKCALEYPQQFGQIDGLGGNTLVDDFERWAQWVKDRVKQNIAEVFPADETGKPPAVYFWARTMRCQNPSCAIEIPLVSSLWLARSSRRTAWIEMSAGTGRVDIAVRADTPPEGRDLSTGTVKASSVTCPICETSVSASDVRKYGQDVGLGTRLYAVMEVTGHKRTYRSPHANELEGAQHTAARLLEDLQETPDGSSPVPDEICDQNGFRRVQSLIFGFDTWRTLFNERQLYVLGSLCEAVRSSHDAMIAQGMADDRALAVATYLGLCVDRIADYNCGFTTWVPSGEFHAHVFKRQAIAMVWDFVEIEPFQEVSGSWDGAVKWISLAIQHCSQVSSMPASVQRGDAQHLAFPDETFDAVIVDPPYYDAIQYSYLSDFFYVWLKRSVGHLYPDLFATLATPKKQEVIQNQAKKTSDDYVSGEEFDRRLQTALREIARVTKVNGIVSIVFAHTDVEAWERLLRALRKVDLVVSTSWPMRSERAARSNAMLQHAVLGSSVVLVCRRQEALDEGFYDEVVTELEQRIDERLAIFEEMQLQGADYFVSAIGPAFEVFARYKRVVRLSGEEVGVDELMVLARQAVARHAARRLLQGASLAALDDRDLMYLTWRWAYDGEAIPADEAYKLGRAFDLDFSEMMGNQGIIKKVGDKFILLGPAERQSIDFEPGDSLIDVLQAACQLHDSGRRDELASLLGSSGASNEPGFWALAAAIAESLPDGDKERTMLLGLTANRDTLESAARRAEPVPEIPSLFGTRNPSLFGDEDPTLFDRSPS